MTTQVLDTTQRPSSTSDRWPKRSLEPAAQAVLLLCALAIALDGLDNQFSVRHPVDDQGMERYARRLRSGLALGFVGMTIGTPIGGIVATARTEGRSDRFGFLFV